MLALPSPLLLALFSLALVVGVAVPFALRRQAAAGARIVESLDALPADARVVVLGCHVETADGRPNRLFLERVAAGAAAYHSLATRGEGATPRVLASGHGRLGETDALRAALLEAGVPADAIELDPAGERTIRTIEHLADTAHAAAGPQVLVTQRFHLPRALWLAARLGVDARGLPAAGTLGRPRGRLREHLAWLRAILDVVWRRARG